MIQFLPDARNMKAYEKQRTKHMVRMINIIPILHSTPPLASFPCLLRYSCVIFSHYYILSGPVGRAGGAG